MVSFPQVSPLEPRRNKMSLFLLRDTPSRNTPPEDPSGGGGFYLRIILSPEEAIRLVNIY